MIRNFFKMISIVIKIFFNFFLNDCVNRKEIFKNDYAVCINFQNLRNCLVFCFCKKYKVKVKQLEYFLSLNYIYNDYDLYNLYV